MAALGRIDDPAAGRVGEDEIAFGVTGDEELALVELAVVRAAQAHAVALRVHAALGLLVAVVDVDVAAPATARHAATTAVAQVHGSQDRARDVAAALDDAALLAQIADAGAAAERRGGRGV